MDSKTINIYDSQKKLILFCFSLFSGWLLSFPFNGPILNALLYNRNININTFSLASVFAHFLGLLTAFIYIINLKRAKHSQIIACITCFFGSLLFLGSYISLWMAALIVVSFISGWALAGWAYYFKHFFEGIDRMKMIADLLIYSNAILLIANLITNLNYEFIGLIFILICLLGASLLSNKLPSEYSPLPDNSLKVSSDNNSLMWAMVVLCLYVFSITINSGIMYQVVYPAYKGFERITSFYQVIPYIFSIWLIKSHVHKMKQYHILYIGLALLGLSYVFFIILDRSIISYFIVNTLMLAACGINDLFWWSILGAMLDYSHNPTQIFGIGLSMNVLGIWIGGIFAIYIIPKGGHIFASSIALIVIFIVMFVIPLLNNKLTQLLNEHIFLIGITEMNDKEKENILVRLKEEKHLTEREIEIFQLLAKGDTYKSMAKQLYISENTLKTHVKNIYAKMEINSRIELIKKIEGNFAERSL